MQQILDQFGLGKIQTQNQSEPRYIKTGQGEFAVANCGSELGAARKAQSQIQSELDEQFDVQLCHLPDFQGEPKAYSSLVHKEGKYYAVFRITKR